MSVLTPKPCQLRSGLAAAVLLLAAGASHAQSVNLSAGPATATLPDGAAVPMWGYSCDGTQPAATTATCAPLSKTGGWSPVKITVPYVGPGTSLTINLTNKLVFQVPIPTSIVIVGQIGGGLGDAPTTTPSPEHAPQGLTWPSAGPAVVPSGGCDNSVAAGNSTNCPPAQPPRVQSFATEVAAGGAPVALKWNNLQPGTYLIESGTHPSIQGAMGLYGVLVVTTPGTGAAGTAYAGVAYDADATMVFGEIDPLQNQAVADAVATPGFSETRVWSGQPGQCGDPAAAGTYKTCYPPTVNYDPRYYLINGAAFDRTNPTLSTQAILGVSGSPAAVGNGTVLLRLVNAGLRMHVPSVVGRTMTLYAEDGNLLPGVPRVQSEVFMAAGKAYDVGIKPAQNGSNYAPQTYAVYDRQLSLSTNNQRDGGMIAYVNVAGATSGAGTAASAASVTANPDSYYLVAGSMVAVADPLKGVIANDVGVYGVAVLTPPTGGTLNLKPDGTFTYVPNSGTTSDKFTYCANPTAGGLCAAQGTVALAECTVAANCKGGVPTANADTYASNVSSYLKIGSPGVLENDTDPSGLPLTVDTTTVSVASAGLTVTLQPDGSFIASSTSGGQPTFTYRAKNSQGTLSSPATVTLNFPAATNLPVRVVDAKVYAANPADHGKDITDYRWIIEEDRTFHVDPACQINDPTHAISSASCPSPVPSLGYNFHTATLGVVAAGCTGPVSCEAGQSIGATQVACDVGDGQCRSAAQKDPVLPSQVHLDPSKRYYLSILPADGVNPVISGAGGSPDGVRKFDIAKDCKAYDPNSPNWVPGGPAGGYPDGVFGCGHMMGGAQISSARVSIGGNALAPIVIALQETPAPTAKVTAFVFEDDWPLNGENDAGGGVDILAPQEPGLGGFEIKLFDQAGGLGDNTGQITYDMFNQPVSNALAGTLDPNTHQNACPITVRTDGLVGMVPTCPTYEADGKTLSPLAGQVVIDNLYPGLYEIQAFPAADRIGRGEEWLQTNTLDGGKPHEAFLKNDEPAYFQEFGPGGFHVSIGFANPKIINDRRHNSAGTGICDAKPNGGGLTCTATLKGTVTNAHMSRTPDQRIVSTGTYDNYSFTQCYVGIGPQDEDDFAFVKCDANGHFEFDNIPTGDWKIVVFDQWNDIMLDGLVSPVKVQAGVNTVDFPVTQWRTNLYTRTFLDQNGDGVSQAEEPGLPLVATNIRYRDGSYGFFNNTDLDGYAGFNEVFPFMNWLVVEADTTRYKVTGVHSVNDTGGIVDAPASDSIAAGTASTVESNSLPINLRVPGAVYCTDANCSTQSIQSGPYYTSDRATSGPTVVSSGRIDPPGTTTEAWQGLLGLNNFLEFGVKPFVPGENGGIRGHVIYASTRPFDDPQLLLQLSWEPGVAHVKVNLYQEGTAADGTKTLKLVDTTTSSSWDDYAQGFRTDGVPNMNCPGQDPNSPFFATLKDSKQWLDPSQTALPNNAQFKCYDGWSMLNQVQPAPYDGMYRFPSVTAVDPVSGRPAHTNCTVCVKNPDPNDGNPMLPPGKYVVEVIVPPGYELVKEEDKNILLGDTYIAPVTQQFPAGFGNVFIMPDQAAVNAHYNKNNPLNATSDLGATPRHEGDTGSIEAFWPCVGVERIVPDYNSLMPTAGQNAPFAGASRHLCDRKEVTLADQSTALAKFYIFTPTHVAGHFTGTITNDFASEFDPFSPQFGEKFGPPNLPVALRDYTGNEMGRVYSDQWGIYNGVNYSSYAVNPPNPTGYIPQMMIACMNDPGPIPVTDTAGNMLDANGNPVADRSLAKMITDPNYNPAYSNFCYEQPFMPGFTTYMDTPVIPTQAFADGYNLPDSEYPDGTPGVMSVVNSGTSTLGPWVAAPGATVTITSIGKKVVQNPAFSGPSATTAPFNQKTITRNYGFGAQGPRSKVTIGGINAPISSWSDGSITVQVPPGLSNCGVGQITGRSGSGSPTQRTNSQCGELAITGDNGKQSIDAITITVGGKAPTKYVAGEDGTGHAIQNAIDAAVPGDLIIIGPGTYKEQVLMWKPVRLQGVGSGAVVINADAHPAGKMDAWRRQVNCLFGLTIDGVPNPNNANFDPNGATCPNGMFLRDGRIDFEGFVGWDASANGNLAQVLQEPTLMGAYEGAGITVLGRGIREPNGSPDFWGQPQQGGAGAGAFPAGSRYLTSSNTDCTVPGAAVTMRDYGTGNFYCNPSRIDGLSIINSSQGGGAIFLHGWNHNLEVANTRIYANHGTLTGGINLGNGEVPPTYINDGTICGPGVAAPAPLCPPLQGTPANGTIPFALNVNVHVHHNDIYNNASLGDALFSGTPSGGGAITVSAGADNYVIDHNWIAGNLSSSDGGGIVHSGFIMNGRIANNWVLFNQTVNPTLPTNGGGIGIIGSNSDRTLASTGTECGSTNDVDCIPGIGDGTGPGLVIDSNLIIGNSAESGSGGGLRLQQVNGSEVGAFPRNPDRWYDVTVTNNVIANNVAGWDGAGISLEDTLRATLVNNTIASNDTTASAGVLFKALNAPMASSPPPGCTQPDPGVPLPAGCTDGNAPHNPQPAGLVTMVNTPNLIASMPAQIICPSGFSYGNASDTQSSRTNGRCRQISLPLLANDLFWQNRAFHVGYADLAGNEVPDPVKGGTVGGSSQSQQNLVALFPALNQGATGECVNQAAFPNYWDVGVRGDTSPTNHTIVGFASVTPGITTTNPLLSVNNSILTANPAGYVNATNVRVPASSPLVGQYCNGSRVPPENGGHGYQAPPGRSETTGLSPVFTFNNIQVAATVDEGNNWINLGYGPLTLFNSAGQDMVNSADGITLGAYSSRSVPEVLNGGLNSVAPNHDFFGTPRPRSSGNPADIGAVELPPPPLAATVSPSPLAFGNQVVNTTSATMNLTVTNTGTNALAGGTVSGIAAPFARVTSGTFPGNAPNCVATLAVGASCTVKVQFTPTGAQAYDVPVTVAYTSASVTPTPVHMTGTGTTPVLTAAWAPTSRDFGNATRGVGTFTAPTQMFALTNTGNSVLNLTQQAQLGGTNSTEFSIVRLLSTCGPAGGGQLAGQATLQPGQSCVVTVQFRPQTSQTTGGKSATLTIADPAGTQTAALTGNAQ